MTGVFGVKKPKYIKSGRNLKPGTGTTISLFTAFGWKSRENSDHWKEQCAALSRMRWCIQKVIDPFDQIPPYHQCKAQEWVFVLLSTSESKGGLHWYRLCWSWCGAAFPSSREFKSDFRPENHGQSASNTFWTDSLNSATHSPLVLFRASEFGGSSPNSLSPSAHKAGKRISKLKLRHYQGYLWFSQ